MRRSLNNAVDRHPGLRGTVHIDEIVWKKRCYVPIIFSIGAGDGSDRDLLRRWFVLENADLTVSKQIVKNARTPGEQSLKGGDIAGDLVSIRNGGHAQVMPKIAADPMASRSRPAR